MRHHVEEEEGKMLPLAERVLKERLQALGDEMAARKQELTQAVGKEEKAPHAREATRT